MNSEDGHLCLVSSLWEKASTLYNIKCTVKYNVDVCVVGFYKCSLAVGKEQSTDLMN